MGLGIFLSFWLSAQPPGDPVIGPDDRQRFPDWGVVNEQTYRLTRHRERLEALRPYHPHGEWERWLAEIDWMRRYWDLVTEAGWGEPWTTQAMTGLHKMLGEERYRAGWHPLLLPADLWPEAMEPAGEGP